MLEATSPMLALPLMTLAVVVGVLAVERTQVAVRVLLRRRDDRDEHR